MPVFTKPIEEEFYNRSYSSLSATFMDRTIRRFIREHTPEVSYGEDGYPILPPEQLQGLTEVEINTRRQQYTPEELKTLMTHHQEILNYAIQDKLVMGAKPNPENLNNYIKLQKPGYTPLTESEMTAREQFSEDFRTKYADYIAKRMIVINLMEGESHVNRSEHCLFKPDLSEEGIAWNRELAKDLSSKDSAVKKAAYGRALKRIAEECDLENLDLTDAKSISDNFDKCYGILSAGPEIRVIIAEYREMKGNEDPELDKQMGKLYSLEDVSGILRTEIDVIASPVYSMVRTEELTGDPNYTSHFAIGNNDKVVDPEHAIYPDQPADNYFISNFKQIASTNILAEGTAFLDKSLTPQQRLDRSLEDFKVKEAERLRKIAEEAEKERLRQEAREAEIREYVNMDRMPAELSPEQREKRINYEIQLRKNIKALQKAIKDSNDEYEAGYKAKVNSLVEKYTKDVLNADATLTGQERADRLRTLSSEKDKAVQKLQRDREENIVKDLNLTEDQIQAYLSPERMALIERAKEIEKLNDERKRIVDGIPTIPGSFGRVLFASVKDPKEPGAEEHNSKIKGFINSPDYGSQLDRRQLIVDEANAIKGLDSKKMSFDLPFNQMAEYALDNTDACEVGFEFQKTHSNMVPTMAFSEKEELKGYMKDMVDKGVVLGGRGLAVKDLLSDDKCITIPFEQLDGKQMSVLYSSACAKPQDYGLKNDQQARELNKYSNFIGLKENQGEMTFKEPDMNQELNLASFEEKLPDLEELKNRLTSIENRMNETDHWYNRRSSSDEYREMRSAMQELKEELAVLNTQAGNPEKLSAVSARLTTAVEAYLEHVGDKPVNENQRLRAEAAKELKGIGVPSKLISGMIKNNAVAGPEDRALYSRVTAPQVQRDLAGEITQQIKARAETAESSAVKQLHETLAFARDELSNQLKMKPFDPNHTKAMLATAITCQIYKDWLEGVKDPDNALVSFDKQQEFSGLSAKETKIYLSKNAATLMTDKAFEKVIPNLTEKKLQKFLESNEPERTALMRELYSSVIKEKERTEINISSSVPNRSHEPTIPQIGARQLGPK